MQFKLVGCISDDLILGDANYLFCNKGGTFRIKWEIWVSWVCSRELVF
ncbi:hypothetical protein HMPREF3156_01972 [Neisseria sp. HMSC06F02]|nr:hypothetical protein HMPREF3156_01972 [Neisseria sp. HMSC06F02]